MSLLTSNKLLSQKKKRKLDCSKNHTHDKIVAPNPPELIRDLWKREHQERKM